MLKNGIIFSPFHNYSKLGKFDFENFTCCELTEKLVRNHIVKNHFRKNHA